MVEMAGAKAARRGDMLLLELLLPPRTVRFHDKTERAKGSTGTADKVKRFDAQVEVVLDDPTFEEARSPVAQGTRPKAKKDLSWAAHEACAVPKARQINKAGTTVMVSLLVTLSLLRTIMIRSKVLVSLDGVITEYRIFLVPNEMDVL